MNNQKQTDVNSVEATRINSMAELISTLAHELNQPLTTIAMYAQACLRNLNDHLHDPEMLSKALRTIAQQAEQAGEVIHRLKNAMPKRELFLEQLAINTLILKMASSLEYETRDNAVSIQYQLIEGLPLVHVDRIQTTQVLLNLIRYLITILTAAKITEPKITIRTVLYDPIRVAVQLFDNGSGFLEKSLGSLEIASCDKEMDLAISRTAIEAQGGQLTMSHDSAVGTCLQFTLPRVQENQL